MNKFEDENNKFRDCERKVSKFYEKAAFGAIHFDGQAREAAVISALDTLERAQAHCLDENMQSDDLKDACSYLSQRNTKCRPLLIRFWNGLLIPDQSNRFEQTAQTLRVIYRQFGGYF